MDDLLQEFIAETRETLGALAGEIVAWEADPADRARLDAIFRFVHTVKGSCGFLDLPRLARLSHAAEDVLAAVRSGERNPDPALVNAVLAIVDRIGEIVEAIDAGASLPDTSEDLLIAALDESAEPQNTPATTAAAATAPRLPTRSIRLSVDLLDRMMSGVSEMVLARNELARRVRDSGDTAIESTLDRLSLTVAELRETVTRTRMQTIDALFSALPRVVRDTAASLGKQVALTIDGADVELDREMIEMLRDPLVHMVRNSLDHGIETPAERRVAGKRETGRLHICARQSGNRILVEIADDGRGVDTNRLVAKLAAADPSREMALHRLSERGRLDLIFEPGLSSRDDVSSLSGRGVGMDVVRTNVEQIGGATTLANQPGQGLAVTIEVPLTLAILSAIVIESNHVRFAVPRQAVDEIVSGHAAVVRVDRIGDADIVTVRDRRLPLVSLESVLGGRAVPPEMLVILQVPGGAYALAVDAVLDTEELVVKPAAPAVMSAGIYSGQTLPDNGRPLLLLDCAGIATVAGLNFTRAEFVEEAVPEAPVDEGVRALLFDDVDGTRRAIPLAAVDRIEGASTDAVRFAAGRWWMTTSDGMVPLSAIPPEAREITMLRLHDDRGAVAHPIAEALEIVTLPSEIAPAAAPGAIAGVVLIAGEPVELVDPLWLLDATLDTEGRVAPLCLLHGADSDWMEAFLKPAIEAAGYRVARRLNAGEIPAVALAMEDDPDPPAPRVVRLSRDRTRGLHRADRTALIAALAKEIAS
jgi:two-component system, chemotaxis family, sensor kinase CheA